MSSTEGHVIGVNNTATHTNCTFGAEQHVIGVNNTATPIEIACPEPKSMLLALTLQHTQIAHLEPNSMLLVLTTLQHPLKLHI